MNERDPGLPRPHCSPFRSSRPSVAGASNGTELRPRTFLEDVDALRDLVHEAEDDLDDDELDVFLLATEIRARELRRRLRRRRAA
jgi:hypothetical protein